MNRYKQIIASSIVTAVIALAPLVSSAATNNNYRNANYGRGGVYNSQNISSSNSNNSKDNSGFLNSLWSRFSGWFSDHARIAKADTNQGNDSDGDSDDNGSSTSPRDTSLRTTNTMPVISGITAPTVLPADQTGTWTVNAFDPQNQTLTYAVDWGDNAPGPMLRAQIEPVFTQTSTFTHAYDNPGTYTIRFTVTNSAGKQTTSTVTVHITAPLPTVPVISNLVASSTKPHQATVTWNTDVKGSSLVWFSTSTPVDTSGSADVIRSAKVTSHSIKLTKLQPDTLYYVVVGSADTAGTGTSSEVTFTTTAIVNKNAPTITSLVGSTTIATGTTETVTVNAQDPKNGNLSYSVNWGDTPPMMAMALLAPQETFNQTSTFTHVYENTGTYTATFTVKNDAGLSDAQSLIITVTQGSSDVTPPVISNVPANINASATSSAGAIVTYTNPTAIDNVDGSVPVDCVPPSGSLFAIGSTTVACSASDMAGNSSQASFNVFVSNTTGTTTGTTTPPVITLNGNATTTLTVGGTYTELGAVATDVTDDTDTVVISGDVVNTAVAGTYHVDYNAVDSLGNHAVQVVRTVIVQAPADITPPVISNVGEAVGNSTSTITWMTNEPADSQVLYSKVSPVIATSSNTFGVSDPSLVTSHSLNISGLATSTLYHFYVESKDASNNTATSSEMTFTTTSGM